MAVLSRHALFGTAVMAAMGIPYAFSDNEGGSPEQTPAETAGAADDSAGEAATALMRDFPSLRDTSLPVEGPAVADLAEVLRFDVSPTWLMSRWPRVMNARHEAGPLQAYRVPLVTGAKEGDLAGSLTYSFDAQQKLQRIDFRGSTGDPTQLVNFLARGHGFQRRTSSDPSQQVYDVRYNGRVVSQLIVRNAPLIDASLPQARFHLELRLERPSEHRMFSDATQHRFESHRWP